MGKLFLEASPILECGAGQLKMIKISLIKAQSPLIIYDIIDGI